MKREVFGSRFAFIAAGIGMAVGTGNLWRFPRVVGEWGGGTFLIALLIACLVWAIPLLMAESLLGSKSRKGTVGAFRDFMGEKFAWMGAYMGLITIGIMFYYSVVCGWALRYFIYSLTGTLNSGVNTEQLWEEFTSSPIETIGFHIASVLIVGVIVYRGLKGGFEKILNVAIPSLFVIVVILVLRAVTLPGAEEGLRHVFVPDWGMFGNAEMWLQAFTQMAFSTGAGWGLYLTYSVYMRKKEDQAANASILSFADVLAGMLAATAIMGTLYALRGPEFAAEAAGSGNEGLAFIYFAELITEMPGGAIFGPLFFGACTLAGISSLIAMVELATRNVMDMGFTRQKTVIGVVGVTIIAGIPSALSMTFFVNQDSVWGIGLIISGLLAALAMMKYGLEKARAELDADADFKVGAWWPFCIRLFPVLFVLLFGWWLYQSAFVDEWWNPFQDFSLATMVIQWALLLVVVLALNKFFNRRLDIGAQEEEAKHGR